MGVVALNPEKYTRKIIPLEHPLAEPVRKFRFRHEIGTEADAYRRLIEKGLEAFEREEAEGLSEPPPSPAQPSLRVRRPKG